LREARAEAWTRKTLHEEVCRTLEVSKQMHGETNETVAVLSQKFAELEARSAMDKKVTERMLADSWQANALKDEQVKILTSSLPPISLRALLDDKQRELHDTERHLVTTQRLVETLNDQLKEAKSGHSELEIEKKKLESQVGEAQMRLDHDSQHEGQLKAELEIAKTDAQEWREGAEYWHRIATAKLDAYTPDFLREMKAGALTSLQATIDELEVKRQALVDINEELETAFMISTMSFTSMRSGSIWIHH
jgi:myosin heavy subunit